MKKALLLLALCTSVNLSLVAASFGPMEMAGGYGGQPGYGGQQYGGQSPFVGQHYSVSNRPMVNAQYAMQVESRAAAKRADLHLIVDALRNHYEGKPPVHRQISKWQYWRMWSEYNLSPYRFGLYYDGTLASAKKRMQRSHKLREEALKQAFGADAPTPSDWKKVFLPEGSAALRRFEEIRKYLSNPKAEGQHDELLSSGIQGMSAMPSMDLIDQNIARILRELTVDVRMEAFSRPGFDALKFPFFIPRISYWKEKFGLGAKVAKDPTLYGIFKTDSHWLAHLNKRFGQKFKFKELAKQVDEDAVSEDKEGLREQKMNHQQPGTHLTPGQSLCTKGMSPERRAAIQKENVQRAAAAAA